MTRCIKCRAVIAGETCAVCYPPPPARRPYTRFPEWQRMLEEMGLVFEEKKS